MQTSEMKKQFPLEIPNCEYSLTVMKESDISKVVEIYYECMTSPTTPLFSYLTVSKKELTEYYTLYFKEQIDYSSGLNLVVLDRQDEIVGFFLTKDVFVTKKKQQKREQSEFDAMKKTLSQNMQFYVDIMNAIVKCFFRQARERGIKKVLLFGEVGILPKARGHGISTFIAQYVESEAFERGYDVIFGAATNRFSKRAIINLGKILAPPRKVEFWEGIEFDKFLSVGKEDFKLVKPFKGCNEAALKYLKENGLYKEDYGDDICKFYSVFVIDLCGGKFRDD